MLASLLLLVLLAAGAVLALQLHRSREQLGDLQSRLRQLDRWQRESARLQAQIEQLQQLQRAAESTVCVGTSTVRSLHRGIAAIPFGILEAIPVTRDTTRVVRAVHDQISDVVYGSILGGNRLIGSVLRQGIVHDVQGGDLCRFDEGPAPDGAAKPPPEIAPVNQPADPHAQPSVDPEDSTR